MTHQVDSSLTNEGDPSLKNKGDPSLASERDPLLTSEGEGEADVCPRAALTLFPHQSQEPAHSSLQDILLLTNQDSPHSHRRPQSCHGLGTMYCTVSEGRQCAVL
jgi:hypothetical protein